MVRYIQKPVKQGVGYLMIWSSLTYNGISVVFEIEIALDGKLYRKLMDEKIEPIYSSRKLKLM